MRIQEFEIQPKRSIISNGINRKVDYTDSFEITIPNDESWTIDYLTALVFSSAPSWVGFLLNIRNKIVKPLGLQSGLNPEPVNFDKSIHYKIGNQIFLFTVINRSKVEIVMGENDKHLYFRASVFIDKSHNSITQSLYLTTIVQFHNSFGKLYFIPVKPFHKLIIKSLLRNFRKNIMTIQNANKSL